MFASYIETLRRNYIPVMRDLGDMVAAFPLYFNPVTPGKIVMLWDDNMLRELQKITQFPVKTILKAYAHKFQMAIENSPFTIVKQTSEGYELTYKGPALNVQNLDIDENVPGNVMREVMANIHKSRRAATRRAKRSRRTKRH